MRPPTPNPVPQVVREMLKSNGLDTEVGGWLIFSFPDKDTKKNIKFNTSLVFHNIHNLV